MAWLTDWDYRKQIIISNTGSSLTDYQVLVTIDTASLVSSGKLLSNCNDIRFTYSDSSTTLDYWIESGCNTSSTKIWVKIPYVASGANAIYLYYGNPSATSSSNGTSTFDFFGDTISKFTVIGNAFQNGVWIDIPHPNTHSWGTQRITTTTNATRPTIVEFHQKQSGKLEALSLWGTGSILTNIYSFYDRTADNTLHYRAPITFLANETQIYTDVKFKLIITPTNGAIFYRDEIQKASTVDDSSTTYPIVFENYLQGTTLSISNVIFRKYVEIEPTLSSIGIEETSSPANITATLMTITPSETPCIAGTCVITVVVRWSNSGGIEGSVIPNITIDTVPQTPHASRIVTAGSYIDETFIISGLSAGIHTICPDPN